MKPQLKLIRFMEEKAKKVQELTGLPKETYFNKQDAKHIMEWSDDVCEEIWTHIRRAIFIFEVCNLGTYICPFCYKANDDCLECEYAKTHMECWEENSDYKKIMKLLETERKTKSISNEFYKKIFNQIEKEGSNE